MQQYEKIINDIKTYIERNISNEINVEDIAKQAGYSTKQLNRIFIVMTGITLSEYLRWTRLTKSVFELKYSDAPIIDIALKYGYTSQEAFTRIFKEIFGVTPGRYRESEIFVNTDNLNIINMLNKETHTAIENGLYKKQQVYTRIIQKPARIWAVALRNYKNLSPHDFYDVCDHMGIMEKVDSLPDLMMGGGAYLTMENGQLCFGAELDDNYPMDLLDEYEVFHIPQTYYVIFYSGPYAPEAQGSVIESLMAEQKEFDPAKHGMKYNFNEAPMIETATDEFGYMMFYPMKLVAKEEK